MNISCTTPSVRPEMLGMVADCLKKQDYLGEWEWLVGTPKKLIPEVEKAVGKNLHFRVLVEPPKRRGDFYSLNQCWNLLFSKAEGDLIVNIVDGIWFPPETLSSLWFHYEGNPRAIISCIGHQYKDVVEGKPENMVWKDPRARLDHGSFYEVEFTEMEFCLASLPRQALLDIGGFDSAYDRGAAVSEKEAMARAYKAGYKLYLEQSLEYRALAHPRLHGKEEWDKHYKISNEMLARHLHEINSGGRLKLSYVVDKTGEK